VHIGLYLAYVTSSGRHERLHKDEAAGQVRGGTLHLETKHKS
jgi:hypothetical protein